MALMLWQSPDSPPTPKFIKQMFIAEAVVCVIDKDKKLYLSMICCW